MRTIKSALIITLMLISSLFIIQKAEAMQGEARPLLGNVGDYSVDHYF